MQSWPCLWVSSNIKPCLKLGKIMKIKCQISLICRYWKKLWKFCYTNFLRLTKKPFFSSHLTGLWTLLLDTSFLTGFLTLDPTSIYKSIMLFFGDINQFHLTRACFLCLINDIMSKNRETKKTFIGFMIQ